VGGALHFYKPTAGTFTLAGGTYKVLSATQASGPYTVAVSVAYSSLTWRATDGTGLYVTDADLGLTVSATAWYRDQVIDSGNLSAEGEAAVYGGDTASATCLVTFSGLTAGSVVSCRLSGTVTVQGVTYPVAPYSATVAGDGTATLTLPRCDAGSYADGSTGVPFGYFEGASPAAWVITKRIPDSATATFAGLVSP
jgi:hypothetical protein